MYEDLSEEREFFLSALKAANFSKIKSCREMRIQPSEFDEMIDLFKIDIDQEIKMLYDTKNTTEPVKKEMTKEYFLNVLEQNGYEKREVRKALNITSAKYEHYISLYNINIQEEAVNTKRTLLINALKETNGDIVQTANILNQPEKVIRKYIRNFRLYDEPEIASLFITTAKEVVKNQDYNKLSRMSSIIPGIIEKKEQEDKKEEKINVSPLKAFEVLKKNKFNKAKTAKELNLKYYQINKLIHTAYALKLVNASDILSK